MSKNFFWGFLIGTISGTVFGLLVAPKSGKEMRRDIVNYTSEIKDKVNKQITSLGKISKEKYREIIETTVDEYKKLKKIGAEEADDIKNDLYNKYQKIKEIIES